jgi:hypothetical protein
VTDPLEALIEHVAERAAEIVLEQLARERREDGDRWLDAKAAAAHLGVSRERIYKSPELPRHRWEGRVLYRRSELDRFMEERRE